MAPTALLEGTNLRKTYRLGGHTTVDALRGVDVTIDQGEMVAIMGPSGSGKSTLMHILGLLHAPDPNHGPRPELRFDGRDMVSLGEGERTRIRARRMGFVFQDFNLVPTLTALENVMLACDYAGIRGAAARTAGFAASNFTGEGAGAAGFAAGALAATFFFAAAFLAGAFLAAAFLAAGFLAAGFLAAGFLAAAFLAGAFLAAAFFAGAFLAATFLTAAFLAGAFLAATFFTTAFLAGAFLATTFFAGAFFAAAFLAVAMVILLSSGSQTLNPCSAYPTMGVRFARVIHRHKPLPDIGSATVCANEYGTAI